MVRKIDPLHQLRKKLRGEFRDRLFPTPEAIKDYLDRVVPAAGIVEARDLQIETIDDFIAFDAVRRLALAGGVPRPVRLAYRFAMLPDTEPHDCDWLRCSNFRVTRSGESKRHAE